MGKSKYIDRELSWLAFNGRVLQEAKDPVNPVMEKIKFLAIFSSNLDEFFRVRVAGLRSLLSLKKKSRKQLNFKPSELLEKIHDMVGRQQEEFGRIYRDVILPELEENGIILIRDEELCPEHLNFADEYFEDNILGEIQPYIIEKDIAVPFLKNSQLYFAVRLKPKNTDPLDKNIGPGLYKYALVEIPAGRLPRFVELPEMNGNKYYIFLDEILRLGMNRFFKGFVADCAYSVKLTRDGDLNIDDEFSGSLLNKIKKGIRKREKGVPSRLLYDSDMPEDFLRELKDSLGLSKNDLVPGARYHNFSDFFSFPDPGREDLKNPTMHPLKLHYLDKYSNMFEAIKTEKNILLHFPYQSYDYVTDFFDNAADDPEVTSIQVTQYRVAKRSSIVRSLIRAAKNGKDVMVFVELKARFDEERNIQWAEEMEKAGVKVFYSFPGLKVHAKICLVTRMEDGIPVRYCYLSTGNFNEENAKLYTDIGYLSCDYRYVNELKVVFDFLARDEVKDYEFKHLLVAQFNIREKLKQLIKNEIKNVSRGKKAAISLKLNSIEDKKMIKLLYSAGLAGVKINILCRGICCLAPGIDGMSENISVASIVDRFLEHSRIYTFHNDGDEIIYAASADWMKRNLSRRVEVGFPIYDEKHRKEIKDILKIHFDDNMKARYIDPELKNLYKRNFSDRKVRSQVAVYEYLRDKYE